MKNVFFSLLCATTLITPAEQKRDLGQENDSLQLLRTNQHSFDKPITLLRWNPKDCLFATAAHKRTSCYPDYIDSSASICDSTTDEQKPIETYDINSDIQDNGNEGITVDWLDQQHLVLGFNCKKPSLQIVSSNAQTVFKTQNYPNDYGVKVLSCHPTESKIVFSARGQTYIWNRERDKYENLSQDDSIWPIDLKYDPEGKIIAMGGSPNLHSEKGVVCLWDPRNNKSIHIQNLDIADENDFMSDIIEEDNTPVRRIEWNRNGSLVAIAQKHLMHVWDYRSRSILQTVKFASKLNDLCWSPDGSWVASGSADGVVRLWDANSAKCTAAKLLLNNGAVTALDWSSVTNQLAAGDQEGTVHLLKVGNQNLDDSRAEGEE